MDNVILMSVLSIGGIGIFFGLILGYAGEKLKVEQDPKIGEIRDVLPGANCGGCGYAGCDAFAVAVVEGAAPVDGCPVGGTKCAQAVAGVMGIEAKEGKRQVAFVKCIGDCEKSKDSYNYIGMEDCNAMSVLANSGSKSCNYGCLGGGTCVRKCKYDALEIIDGIAYVDSDKCVGCTMCVAACPKNIIEMKPADMTVKVSCSSKDNGKVTKGNCTVGCIGCKICTKQCEFDAISVDSFLAKVDYDKCTLCEKCVEKCPAKIIQNKA